MNDRFFLFEAEQEEEEEELFESVLEPRKNYFWSRVAMINTPALELRTCVLLRRRDSSERGKLGKWEEEVNKISERKIHDGLMATTHQVD